MTVRMGYVLLRSIATIAICTSVPKRTKRRGETPGQERHSGRTAKAILTLSLLRAHFYTGVFHTSYVRSARLTADNYEVASVLRHSVPNKGLHPLRCYAAIPAPL